MHDEFIEHETWYFQETRSEEVRQLYPDLDEDTWEFVLDKYTGLHMMHLTASVSQLQGYFEDMFTDTIADTEIGRKVKRGRILASRDGILVILSKDINAIV
jgi:hypothetical protein